MSDALSAVLGKATAAIREHEAGSRSGGNMENVHQMRVATRRIRAYLRAARPALDEDMAGGLRRDLADLASALGAVRDLDVMIDRMHAEAGQLDDPDGAALSDLIDNLDADRVQARHALVRQLDMPGYDALLSDLDRAANVPPVYDPWIDLADLAANEFAVLAKGQRRLTKKFGSHPPDDDLHALRILGKRARYAAELLPKKAKIAAYLAALAAFQETLGEHQDACVLEEQLRAMLAVAATPDVVAAAVAAGRVIAGCRERKEAARQAWVPAWKVAHKAAEAAFGERLS